MRRGPYNQRPAGPYLPISKFRRRFAKFLIALGLIYIGAAISAVNQPAPVQPISQQFLTVPTASTGLLTSPNQTSKGPSVLAQNTTSLNNPSPPPVFIPACSYRSVPFKTVYKTASWLDEGQTITTGGMDGEEKICSSQFGSPTVTTIISPLDKTITSGTYVLPTYTYPGYVNSDGNYIPSPSYTGGTVDGYSPTAICNDGTYSYSQHTSGTCSSHGGVSSWF